MKILITESNGVIGCDDWKTVLWSGYKDNGAINTVSITEFVENNSKKIKEKYLEWVYEIGITEVGSKKIIEHLAFHDGFSYWWMSSVAQKNNLSVHSNINDAIKVLALEVMIKNLDVDCIQVNSMNINLKLCIRKYCKENRIQYVESYQEKINDIVLARINNFIPVHLIALLYLLHYIIRYRPWKKWPSKIPGGQPSDVIFFDILTHLDEESCLSGHFKSNYWGPLIEMCREWKLSTSWLHFYYKNNYTKKYSDANKLIEGISGSRGFNENHSMIEGNIGLVTLKNSIRNYIKLASTYPKIKNIMQSRNLITKFDLWKFHANEFRDSLCGKMAIQNCLYYSTIGDAIKKLPKQNIGIYISENQPWELALIDHWKSCGHGKLVAIPHTLIRPWDLRYHNDPRVYCANNEHLYPIANLIGVNGVSATKALLSNGYPMDRVIQLESLRFIAEKGSEKLLKNRLSGGEINILLCADHEFETTVRLLKWMDIAAPSMPPRVKYYFKSHPSFMAPELSEYSIKYEIIDQPINRISNFIDVVISSNMSSVAIDAYINHIPVIQISDGKSFNNSPFNNEACVFQIKNPNLVAHIVKNLDKDIIIRSEDFLNLDSSLVLWKRLINSNLN